MYNPEEGAICIACGTNMLVADSCSAGDGVRYGDEENPIPGPDGRCHDCGVKPGGFHHPGCDAEECPRCGDQRLAHVCWPEMVR